MVNIYFYGVAVKHIYYSWFIFECGIVMCDTYLNVIIHVVTIYLLREFMVAQRDMSKVIIQRTTRAKKKGKEDLGLKELRKILKDLVEKRNKKNKEKASSRVKSAALARAKSASSKPRTPSSKSRKQSRSKVKTKNASLTITKAQYSTNNKRKWHVVLPTTLTLWFEPTAIHHLLTSMGALPFSHVCYCVFTMLFCFTLYHFKHIFIHYSTKSVCIVFC